MPCDTPPPPPPIEDTINDEDYEEESSDHSEEAQDPDDSNYEYEVIDMAELDEMPKDDALITFRKHTDAVLCATFDRTGRYIVTGGQDEKAYVWNVLDKTIKFECTEHADSVIAVNFSPDSNFVVTADMRGFIQVWDMECGRVPCNMDLGVEVFWAEWLRGANVLLAGSADGMCWKWNIPDETSAIFEHSDSGCTMGCISHNDEMLVTGYQKGTLKFWDIPNHKLLSTLTDSNGHTGSITCIKFKVDDSLIMTGSEDGTAKVIKASDFKVLWTIDGCDISIHTSHTWLSVESVGFCHMLPCVVIGTNCGLLCVWDLQTKTKRHNIRLPSSVTKIICDEFAPILYVAIENGILQAYDVRTGNVARQWEGHLGAIYDLAISSDRTLFLTASEDHSCKIFERGIF